MIIIRAKSPLRISFGGGGTDVSPYPEEKGGAVINATIDRHAYCSIAARKDKILASVPNVVEKGIGISYPIGKPNKNKGGYTDGERIPQGTGIDHARAGVISGRACRPTAGAIRSGGS
jgi:hypothetical protein